MLFSGQFDIAMLRPRDVTWQCVSDINQLLKRQHSQARTLDEDGLVRHLKRCRVAVAWSDRRRVMGMGVLVKTFCVSHTFVGLHNLVVHKECDEDAISLRIAEFLLQDPFAQNADFVEARAWSDDNSLGAILEAFGFRQKSGLYRLRTKRSKKT